MASQPSPLPGCVPAVEVSGEDSDDPHRQAPVAPQPAVPQQPPPSFATGYGQVPPYRPPDPITPFVSGPRPRKPMDWPILLVAMVIAAVVMVGVCLAGYAVYHG
jgi:hypothetical protein